MQVLHCAGVLGPYLFQFSHQHPLEHVLNHVGVWGCIPPPVAEDVRNKYKWWLVCHLRVHKKFNTLRPGRSQPFQRPSSKSGFVFFCCKVREFNICASQNALWWSSNYLRIKIPSKFQTLKFRKRGAYFLNLRVCVKVWNYSLLVEIRSH